jgi:hypothetical protein
VAGAGARTDARVRVAVDEGVGWLFGFTHARYSSMAGSRFIAAA